MIETIKMLEKGTKVNFVLTINPTLRQKHPFRGTVVNYPRGHFTQKIFTKRGTHQPDKGVKEYPVILIRIKTTKRGEFVVDARGVKAIKPAKADLQSLKDKFNDK